MIPFFMRLKYGKSSEQKDNAICQREDVPTLLALCPPIVVTGPYRLEMPTFFSTSSVPTPGPPGTVLVQISSARRSSTGRIFQFGECSALSHLKSST